MESDVMMFNMLVSISLSYSLLFNVMVQSSKFTRHTLADVAGKVVPESVIPVKDAQVVQHSSHFHLYTSRITLKAS